MAFVDEILRLPDVYFVTSQEVIDFTKYPQTLKAIANNEKFGCRRYGQQLFFLRRFFRKANLSSSEGLFDELSPSSPRLISPFALLQRSGH